MLTDRRAGILLHPTSLPSAYGVGDLGPQAYAWLDWLATTGCSLWQVLPLGPTGYGDSPYQCFSSFAGNPLLISPEFLARQGLLEDHDLEPQPVEAIDYGTVIPTRMAQLDEALTRFAPDTEYRAFLAAHATWIEDYALFMAIKETQDLRPWTEWPAGLRDRHEPALDEARERLAGRVEAHQVRQFWFFTQWHALRSAAAERGIAVIGDIPIFVAHDSSDVWTNRELFTVDEAGRLESVAGVPPDYFSPTGQLWGNPLYRWDVHEASGYDWWIRRLRSLLEIVDVARVDHFRAFADYWSIPAGAETAESGQWLDGPSDRFFDAIRAALGDLPIIAEDLGELSPAVPELRDRQELPGMQILQFAFDGDPENPFLPHHYPENSVVYTGTHDNETVRGWYDNASDDERARALALVGGDGDDFPYRMIETAWESRAAYAIAPMQDLLGLDNTGRMNRPGVPDGNWTWRMQVDACSVELAQTVHSLTERTGRLP